VIGNAGRPPTSGQVIPINNGDGGPFGRGGNGPPIGNPLGGGGNGLLRGGDNRPLGDQNSRPYAVELTWSWIKPTWNLWYPSWYPIQPPITPNPPPSKKSLPYPIYIMGMDLDAHVLVFHKAIHANGKKNDADIVNLFCFTLHDAICEWGEKLMRAHLIYKFDELEVTFYKCY
jgi:hypothetical protein